MHNIIVVRHHELIPICTYKQRNTFQALVITDGSETYTVFTYNCNELEWASNRSPAAVIGYNVGSQGTEQLTPFDNYVLSGTENVKMVACVNEKFYIPWSNLVYRIGITDDEIQRQRTECIKQLDSDIQNFGAISSFLEKAPYCPCSLLQARLDNNFEELKLVENPDKECYVSKFPEIIADLDITLTQQCCYSLE